MNIALIEDEIEEYRKFDEFINKIHLETNIEIKISYFDDPIKFISSYKYQFDVIFMDIELPNINGMKASHKLRELDENVPLIFVTNLSQYAIEGYSVKALDYILKPLNYFSLKGIILKLNNIISNKEAKYLIVKDKEEMMKINVDDILYLEVSNHFVSIITKENTFKFWGTLKSYESKLPKNFVLCNQCYLVNLKHVKGIQDGFVLVGDNKLLISRNKKKVFLDSLSEYLGENF